MDQPIITKKKELLTSMLMNIIDKPVKNKVVLFLGDDIEAIYFKHLFGSVCVFVKGKHAGFYELVSTWKNKPGPSILIIIDKFNFFSGIPIPYADSYIIANNYANICSKKLNARIFNACNTKTPDIHVLVSSSSR
jgi:hypothetical protein